VKTNTPAPPTPTRTAIAALGRGSIDPAAHVVAAVIAAAVRVFRFITLLLLPKASGMRLPTPVGLISLSLSLQQVPKRLSQGHEEANHERPNPGGNRIKAW